MDTRSKYKYVPAVCDANMILLNALQSLIYRCSHEDGVLYKVNLLSNTREEIHSSFLLPNHINSNHYLSGYLGVKNARKRRSSVLITWK